MGAITVSVPAPALPSARQAVAGDHTNVFALSRNDIGSTDERIRQLEALLSAGTVRARTPAESKSAVIPSLVELIDSSSLDEDSLKSIFDAFTRNERLLPRLAELDAAGHLTHLIQQLRRFEGLREIRLAVDDPAVRLPALCGLLRREWWVFGGHLMPRIPEKIIPGAADDVIAMLRYDSAIHLVIVGPPHVPDLVAAVEEGGYALSPLVAAAEARARGLVRALDAHEDEVSEELPVEYRRPFVTILIGHPRHVPGLDRRAVREEIRVRNTFVSGITLTTYEELISVAEKTLAGAGERGQVP